MFLVIFVDILLDNFSNNWRFSQNLHPIDLSDHEALTICSRKIAENGSDIEGAVKCTNECLIGISNDKFLLFIDFVPNINLTFLYENNFVNIV